MCVCIYVYKRDYDYITDMVNRLVRRLDLKDGKLPVCVCVFVRNVCSCMHMYILCVFMCVCVCV